MNIIFNKKILLLSGISLSIVSTIVSSKPVIIDNWDVDGANGTIHVHGSLTESVCRLAMESSYQVVELGNISTGELSEIGERGRAIPFKINLEDCIQTSSRNLDKEGNITWSTDIPSMKVNFIAPTDKNNPNLISVNGAEGIGLELSDIQNIQIKLGTKTAPKFINPGQNSLVYYLTPIRTSSNLFSSMYSAQIRFQLSYD